MEKSKNFKLKNRKTENTINRKTNIEKQKNRTIGKSYNRRYIFRFSLSKSISRFDRLSKLPNEMFL